MSESFGYLLRNKDVDLKGFLITFLLLFYSIVFDGDEDVSTTDNVPSLAIFYFEIAPQVKIDFILTKLRV